MPVSLVLVSVPRGKTAAVLARLLLKKRLAACVTIVRGAESFYWWEGRVQKSRESLLLIKTTRSLFPRLKKAIVAVHPYSVPEIIALNIQDGWEPYLRWINKEAHGKA